MIQMPWMSQSEIQTIEKYLKPEFTMLEWGSGGSTLYFPKFVRKYYSIEHDMSWYDNISPKTPNNVDYHLILPNEAITDPTQKHQVQN